MIHKTTGVLGVVGALLVSVAPAWAQHHFEVGATFNSGLSDGVSGDNFLAPDGNIYDRVDPANGFAFSLTAGYHFSEGWEAEFIWARQGSSLDIGGTNTKTIGDLNVYTYHGAVVYNFLDEHSRLRPYVLGGLGANNYGAVTFTDTTGVRHEIDGHTKFSTTWGGGVKVYATPNVGLKAGVRFSPAYIKSDSAGWWCDPYWGCYVVGNAQYATQIEIGGGVTFRF
jgi:opacity protein-like surface antigen